MDADTFANMLEAALRDYFELRVSTTPSGDGRVTLSVELAARRYRSPGFKLEWVGVLSDADVFSVKE